MWAIRGTLASILRKVGGTHGFKQKNDVTSHESDTARLRIDLRVQGLMQGEQLGNMQVQDDCGSDQRDDSGGD